MTTPSPAEWRDGDPLLEAIAEAVWAHYDAAGPGDSISDPRGIAVAVAPVLRTQLQDAKRSHEAFKNGAETGGRIMRQRIEAAEATLARVRAVADAWGEPGHCSWQSASVLVRQLRAALDQQEG